MSESEPESRIPRPTHGASRRSRQTILDAVTSAGAVTRLEVMHRTTLSRATVAIAVQELLAERLLVETHPRESPTRGRRPARLSLPPPSGLVGAIDLGHGHVAVVIGTGSEEAIAQEWTACEVDVDPAAAIAIAIASMSRLLDRCSLGRQLLALAAVVPQPVTNVRGHLVPTPFLRSWHGQDVRGRLEAALSIPVALENDANAGALAEARHGETTVFVKVGTGLGTGLVLSGALVHGYGGQAGEIGHLVVKPDGQLCGCGNRGCLETLASVPAIVRALEPVHGALDTAGLARLLADDDTAAARAMRDAGAAIGTALAPVITAVQVKELVIGGPREMPMEHLVRGVRRRVESLVHPQVLDRLVVRPSAHGANAPLMGALRIAESTARALQSNHDSTQQPR